MRRFVAITTIAAATFGAPATALAGTLDDHLEGAAVSGETCVEVSQEAGVEGLGARVDAQLCAAHDVSTHEVSVRAGGPIDVEFDADPGAFSGGGDEPSGPTPEERLDAILDWIASRMPAGDEGAGDDQQSGSDLYRSIVESAGMSVYEDEVCGDDDSSLEYTADCWWDDYLVGSYARDYLVSYVDGIVPLPGAAKQLVRGVLDDVLVVTNGEMAPPEHEPVAPPALPAVPSPELPEVPELPVPSFDRPDLSGIPAPSAPPAVSAFSATTP